MKRRLQMAAFCFVFCALAILVSLPPSEPEWDGRTVSEWIVELAPYHFTFGEEESDAWEGRLRELLRRKAKGSEAIRNIGPAAIPYLLELLEDEKPAGILDRLMELIRMKVLGKDPERDDNFIKYQRASAGFAALGELAVPALPRPRSILFDDQETFWLQEQLSYCFRTIGKPAIPILVAGLRHPAPEVRGRCLDALRLALTNSYSVLPSIRSLLLDPDAEVRARAVRASVLIETNRSENLEILEDVLDHGGPGTWSEANAFWWFARKHRPHGEEINPILLRLIAGIEGTNSTVVEHRLLALSAFGDRVKPLRQTLINAAFNESEEVRSRACHLLGSNAYDDPEVMSLLVDIARSDSDENVRRWAKWALGEFGEASIKFAPDLETEIRNVIRDKEQLEIRRSIRSKAKLP